jgi:hypothetical protein
MAQKIDFGQEVRSGSALGHEIERRWDKMAPAEALLARQVLRRCATCFERDGEITPHPLAHTPPILDGKCPRCGTPAADPVVHLSEAAVILNDRMSRFGRALMRLGSWLNQLRKRLDP